MEQLREWRRASGITIEEAGRLAGVTGVQWHRYEKGTRKVAPDKAIDVERITGISRHELRPDIFGPAPAEGAAA